MSAPKPLAQQVLDVVPLVMRVIRKEFRSQRDPSLSLPEFRGMAFINRTPGCSLGEVADHIGLEAPSASKLVDHLVQRGLVARSENPDDRRRVQLHILPAGQRSIQAAYAYTQQALSQRLAGLSPAEQQEIHHSLELLRQAFAAEATRDPS